MHAIIYRAAAAFGWLGFCSGFCLAQIAGNVPAAAPNLLVNGDFEQGDFGWSALWTRDGETGKSALDRNERQGGAQGLRIEVKGDQDWSLAQARRLDVKPGEMFELSAWVRLLGTGNATLSVVTRDANHTALNWSHGGRSVRETKGWVPLRSRFVIPPNTASIECRLIGDGTATVWLDDVILTRQGNLDALRNPKLPATLTIHSSSLEVTLHTADGSLECKAPGGERSWIQHSDAPSVVVLDAKAADGGFDLRLLDPVATREIAATVRLDEKRAECVVRLQANGEMEEPLRWPAPFVSTKGQRLILPVNEGISYPVDDASLPSMHYHLYGGHGLCMPWYGATDGAAGWMAIVETADDAAVSIPRRNGLLSLVPEWQPQLERFGPERVIRYIIFERGGHVAMAKRYREYAQATGLFKTLAEKRKAIPAVDLLVGAVNVWCWDKDAPAICRSLLARGIKRILWSNQGPPAELKALNEMNVLTSRYDIYQDAMNPANFPQLRWRHPDWTSEAWANDDLMTAKNGEWVRGWEVETKDGKRLPCGTLCDRQAVPYAKARIPAELATHPYRCRFLDTTTASPWRECYHPKHPMTRTESKQSKMELLRYVAEGCGLVCGSETGHDAAVPYAHYFEGMLSLGPYRVPDSGRDMARTWDEVPEAVAKFQTGHGYRLPLRELVYHDCEIAQWYWGDYNNKLPKLWDRRDLWNALYGSPPMFMFNRQSWEANQDRFVKSYQTTIPVARATGYAEMLSHEWLTLDHAVQRTRFANNIVVTVNFGDSPSSLPDGTTLPPLGLRVTGIPQD
jgi:hypothetical protein